MNPNWIEQEKQKQAALVEKIRAALEACEVSVRGRTILNVTGGELLVLAWALDTYQTWLEKEAPHL